MKAVVLAAATFWKENNYNRQLKDKPTMQVACKPLTDATPPTGKIHPLSKIAITFEQMMRF